jgi:hypothetical protein
MAPFPIRDKQCRNPPVGAVADRKDAVSLNGIRCDNREDRRRKGGAKRGRRTRRPTITMRTLVPKDPYWAMILSDKESGVGVKETV